MQMHQLGNYQVLRFTVSASEKISFRFTPKIDLEKTSKTPHRRPPTPTPMDHRRHANHTETMASCRRRINQPWR